MLTKKIIELLIDKMKELKISQQALSEKIGKEKGYINRVFHSKKNIDIESLSVIAKALNTNILSVIAEATQCKVEINKLPQEKENIVLQNDTFFDLFNILMHEKNLDEILSFFGPEKEEEILKHIKKLEQLEVIHKTNERTYRTKREGKQFLFYGSNEKSTERRKSLIEKCVKTKPSYNCVSNKRWQESLNWRNQNTDIFIAHYFTDNQIQERKKLYKNLFEQITTQATFNEERAPGQKLRVIQILETDYPLK